MATTETEQQSPGGVQLNSGALSSGDLASRNYIRFNSGVEKVPPGEAEDIQAVADLINEAQRRMWNSTRHCYGGTHARTQGLVKGKLIIPDDLPTHLKQSMFAHGGEYPVACRYSSEPGDPGLDVSTILSQFLLVLKRIRTASHNLEDSPSRSLGSKVICFLWAHHFRRRISNSTLPQSST